MKASPTLAASLNEVDTVNPILALLGDFGYSQNGGGTFSDFLIFFSPLLYLLITKSTSLKAAD